MFQRIKAAMYRMLSGRYGVDSFNRFLLGLYFALIVICLFVDSLFLSLLGSATAVLLLLRMLSRNHNARRKENQAYLTYKAKVIGLITLGKDRIRDRKTHVYRTCPHCKATLRLPRTVGVHTVRCPKCANRFEVTVK